MQIKPALLVLPLLAQSFSSTLTNPYSPGQTQNITSPSVTVSATIGAPRMTIWGYGPPVSTVELSGIGVSDETLSNSAGYFIFSDVNLPLPVPTPSYQPTNFTEVCLTAVDYQKRITPPTCVPPIPFGQYFFDVGPVILPPTFSIENGQASQGEQEGAKGSTIPYSDVNIILAKSGGTTFLGLNNFKLVSDVMAAYIPTYTVRSDANGNFSFNLPTSESTTWRVFAVTKYAENDPSPKSNTLKFEVIPSYIQLWQQIIKFLSTFLVWPRILILEILIILLLVAIIYRQKKRKKSANKQSQSISNGLSISNNA